MFRSLFCDRVHNARKQYYPPVVVAREFCFVRFVIAVRMAVAYFALVDTSAVITAEFIFGAAVKVGF